MDFPHLKLKHRQNRLISNIIDRPVFDTESNLYVCRTWFIVAQMYISFPN